ncbi:MAG TPA: hypothetical protein VH371_02580 [Candidatus Limnocylindrales bacterium]
MTSPRGGPPPCVVAVIALAVVGISGRDDAGHLTQPGTSSIGSDADG